MRTEFHTLVTLATFTQKNYDFDKEQTILLAKEQNMEFSKWATVM